MKHRCHFPNCTYETNEKSLIESHHIKPKEFGGSDKSFNRIDLCPIHHKLIYIPESNQGSHSRKHEKSITILNIFKSTNGDFLHYSDINGVEYSYNFDNMDVHLW